MNGSHDWLIWQLLASGGTRETVATTMNVTSDSDPDADGKPKLSSTILGSLERPQMPEGSGNGRPIGNCL